MGPLALGVGAINNQGQVRFLVDSLTWATLYEDIILATLSASRSPV